MRGVDISHYQKGLTIQQIKSAGNDFAIIKLTEGTWLVDKSSFDFYREAYELGFPVGCYCYSHAINAQQAMAEAGYLMDALRGFPMTCGVFLDVEEPKQLNLSHDDLLNVIRGWCAAIGGNGYIPGVYGSEGNLWAKISPDELPDGCLVWVAKWSSNPPGSRCDLWQTSDSGHVDGYSGNVDTDLSRSVRFETLVDVGGCDYTYHKDNGIAEKLPDAPTDSGGSKDPVELACDLLLAYLRSGEFREGFLEYVKNALSMLERR